ncbi:3-hydroxyisobutyryl-CoA hydrolase [compost metagenome]
MFRKGDGVEGIRALAIDKDHKPRWQHARLDDVSREKVQSFFDSPWRAQEHPLAALGNAA